MVRHGLVASALALALLLQFGAATPAHADGETVIAANVSGDLPTAGVFLGLWDGGSVEELTLTQPQVASVWVSVNGALVGYLTGAPSFVNAGFLLAVPQGVMATGTPLLAFIDGNVTTAPSAPPPVATGAYTQATWSAFSDTLLRATYEVSTCEGCWPQYAGTSIGVTTRWTEGTTLKVYVYSGTAEDIATLEAQLNEYQARLGLAWQLVATPAEANIHVFLSFDRLNIPASFPDWARTDLAAQHLVDGWSAFTSTSYEYATGPNGIDPADRFDIEEAVIYVPFNQQSGQLISRSLLDTNIRHELAHGIGWDEHWAVGGRLMSPAASGELTLSELEWDMLALLYDDAVEAGMYADQVNAVISIAN